MVFGFFGGDGVREEQKCRLGKKYLAVSVSHPRGSRCFTTQARACIARMDGWVGGDNLPSSIFLKFKYVVK